MILLEVKGSRYIIDKIAYKNVKFRHCCWLVKQSGSGCLFFLAYSMRTFFNRKFLNKMDQNESICQPLNMNKISILPCFVSIFFTSTSAGWIFGSTRASIVVSNKDGMCWMALCRVCRSLMFLMTTLLLAILQVMEWADLRIVRQGGRSPVISSSKRICWADK